MKKEELIVKVVFGSWKAYNECNSRALGSSWLDLANFKNVDEIYAEMKKQGFTDAELEETFVQDYECNNEDICLWTNCDLTSICTAFNSYQKALKELEQEESFYELKINEHGACDVYFKDKPNEKIIELLRKNGFRWFFKNKCWSAFKSIDEVEAILNGEHIQKESIKNESYTYKSIKEITGEEKINIIIEKYPYAKNYLNGKKEDLDYFNKYYLNCQKIFRLETGEIIFVDTEKPSIDSRLWYDDEQEAPDNTYANFESHNIDYNLHNQRLILNCSWLYKTHSDPRDYDYRIGTNSSYGDTAVRSLTEQEIEDFNNVYLEQETAYKKRLATYWKKYQNKIYWEGYWANR